MDNLFSVFICMCEQCKPDFYSADEETKYCRQCGRELLKKCPGCGSKLTEVNCGRFCINCRTILKHHFMMLSIWEDEGKKGPIPTPKEIIKEFYQNVAPEVHED
ncbi:MAG: hypothetical protein ACD_59C00053G0016 [uncultured bacterium]|nr:MAG: hypothetical protein ACD_59C00053G0016 [uncultured bacterium]